LKIGTDIDDGPLLRPDHKTTPKWARPGSRDQISKFWYPPYNFWTNRDIRFKLGIDIEDGPLLRPDHKTTPKWAWPRSRDQISKFWNPPYNFGTNRVIYFKFGTVIDDGLLLRLDHKMTPKWVPQNELRHWHSGSVHSLLVTNLAETSHPNRHSN